MSERILLFICIMLLAMLLSGCRRNAVIQSGEAAGCRCRETRESAGPNAEKDNGISEISQNGVHSDKALPGNPELLREIFSRLDNATIEGSALLFETAVFHSEPDEESSMGPLTNRNIKRTDPGIAFVPVIVHEKVDGFYRIESISSDLAENYCAGYVPEAFNSYRITGYVKRTDFSPVTASAFQAEFNDGTGVATKAGIPFRATISGPVLMLDHGRIEVPVSRMDYIGNTEDIQNHNDQNDISFPLASLSYVPEINREHNRAHVEPLDIRLADVNWYINGERVRVRDFGWNYADVLSYGPHWDGKSGILAVASGNCWTLTMLSMESNPSIPSSPQASRVKKEENDSSSRNDRLQILPDTPAFWPDGVHAGHSKAIIYYSVLPEKIQGKSGKLFCFPLYGSLRICHRQADIIFP